jgi:hypothetical protein
VTRLKSFPGSANQGRTLIHEASEFDPDYCRKIQDACLKAILETSIGSAIDTVKLQNSPDVTPHIESTILT